MFPSIALVSEITTMPTTPLTTSKRAFERAMQLAVVSGLRGALGVALVQNAYNRPNKQSWALAAMGEMVVDKVPFVPSRANLFMVIPRAAAGAYVAQQVMEKEGVEDQFAAPMGAVVAAGVSVLAPRIRGLLSFILPGTLVGLAEDYLALKIGGEALGITMQDVQQIGKESFQQVSDYVGTLSTETGTGAKKLQSAGAGSM